ncbi:MAG: ECF transporter S component [Anaerolineaceae bacterium]|nr:ECF transporter S component [Anaerolineaceae bacterium]
MKLEDKQGDYKKGKWSTKQIAVMAIFIALSAVGAFIKIPSPIGSIGLDSAPGFFAAVAFGPIIGGIVIAVGHIISAAVVGFPLTIPIHIAIAIGMALVAFVFYLLGRKGIIGLVAGVVICALLNSFALGLLLIPIGGKALYLTMIVPLLAAAAVNLVIAAVAYLALKNSTLLK